MQRKRSGWSGKRAKRPKAGVHVYSLSQGLSRSASVTRQNAPSLTVAARRAILDSE
jgi:hypothetical protein